jgi:hypothetical protein
MANTPQETIVSTNENPVNLLGSNNRSIVCDVWVVAGLATIRKLFIIIRANPARLEDETEKTSGLQHQYEPTFSRMRDETLKSEISAQFRPPSRIEPARKFDRRAQAPKVLAARHLECTEGPQVGGGPLRIEEHKAALPEPLDQRKKRHFRGVRHLVKHRLSEEGAAN